MKKDLGSYSTILVVDDEKMLLDIIQKRLNFHFMTVLTAENGKEALDIINSRSVDIVLTDYMMPVMNGLELIKEIKESHPLIQVIMLTGNGHNPEVLQALKLGAFDVLDKPYRLEVLVNRIQNSLLLPRVIRILWSVLSSEMPTPKIEEFLLRPYDQQLKILHNFSEVLLSRGIVNKIGDDSAA